MTKLAVLQGDLKLMSDKVEPFVAQAIEGKVGSVGAYEACDEPNVSTW
jgi:hypothetical protein